MGKKNRPENQGARDSHEGAKKLRRDLETVELTSLDVEMVRTAGGNGISARQEYISKIERLSLQDVKDHIQRDDEVYLFKSFHLYPAFKEALLRLVTEVEEVLKDKNNPVRVILVHGVPNVGKSSLACCLAYYLALAVGEMEVIKLRHSKDVDTEDLTGKITDSLAAHHLIVDQVNTGALNLQEIFTTIQDKFAHISGSVPLIMFTSGRYAPREVWLDGQKSGWLCYKIIHMKIDDAFLSKLRRIRLVPADGGISNRGLLDVTSIFSRMEICLTHIRDKNSLATEGDLQAVIYPRTNMDLIGKESAVHLLWYAFQEFLIKGLPDREDFTAEHCKIEACCLEYLGYMTSRMKDQDDSGINAIIDSMDITGSHVYENNNYTEYNPSDYFYIFLSKDHLYDTLERIVEYHNSLTCQERYDVILAAFNLFRKAGDSQYNYVAGGVFEFFIRCLCDREGDRRGYPVGMSRLKPRVDFPGVSLIEHVSTVPDLCNLPFKNEMCKRERTSFWCNLNVPGKPAFKGYDFAFMVTVPDEKGPVLQQLELFQVTINPFGKSYEKNLLVTDVLAEIRTALHKKKLIKHGDAEKIVVPYFVHPYENSSKLDLPCRNSSKMISVEILAFPQNFFQEKHH